MVTTGRAPLCVWSASDFAETPCVGGREVHVFSGTQEYAGGYSTCPINCVWLFAIGYIHVKTQETQELAHSPKQAADTHVQKHARPVVTMALGIVFRSRVEVRYLTGVKLEFFFAFPVNDN